MGRGRNGHDAALWRAVESSFTSVPVVIREKFERDEILNETWLNLRRRNVSCPSKLQVKMAAVDAFRGFNKYRRRRKYGVNIRPVGRLSREEFKEITNRQAPAQSVDWQGQVIEKLKALHLRFGSAGLNVFLLCRIMELDALRICEILGIDDRSEEIKYKMVSEILRESGVE